MFSLMWASPAFRGATNVFSIKKLMKIIGVVKNHIALTLLYT